VPIYKLKPFFAILLLTKAKEKELKQNGKYKMNPASPALPAPKGLVQDIKPSYQTPANSYPASVKTEVVSSIPVKDPNAANHSAIPVQNPLSANQPSNNPVAAKELDRILKDVNKDVKKLDGPIKDKFSLGHLKSADLIVPIMIAVLVAVALTAATVLAFRPPPDNVRTRATTQAGL
jgi:hypothetical protein